MNGDRAHDEVVSELIALQGRLRDVDPAGADLDADADAVTVIEDDVMVRVSGIDERVTRLEDDLTRTTARIDQAAAQRRAEAQWRHFPEFNFAPQVFQLTLDDQIALLQGTIAERSDREH